MQLVTSFLHEPEKSSGDGVVLTHGAGGNCASPQLVAIAGALCDAGAFVLRYDLPFRQRRASGPPSPARAVEDRAGIREAVLRMRSLVKGRVVVAGHSYGGRQSSMLAAEEPDLADGLMLMSYPLHPPGKPSQMRTGHFLSLRIPSLFVSGTKDSFGTVAEIRTAMELIPAATRLVPIEGAGHDLAKGRFDVKSLVVAPLWDLVQPAK